MAKKYEENTLGYSYSLDEKIREKLYSLSNSVENELKSLEGFESVKSVEFDFSGSHLERNLELNATVKFKGGVNIKKGFVGYADPGAIEAHSEWIQAYYGEDTYESIKGVLDKHGGTLDYKFLKKNEPVLCNQLAEEYVLYSAPDTNDGSEFTDEDEEFFREILAEYLEIKAA